MNKSAGVLLWGMLLVIWLVKIACMVSEIVGFKEAVCKIKLFKYLNDLQRRGSPADAPSDNMINEAARALAAANANNEDSSNSSDIEQKEEEMRHRESMIRSFSAADNIKKDDENMPATHCITSSMPTACHEGVNPSCSTDVCTLQVGNTSSMPTACHEGGSTDVSAPSTLCTVQVSMFLPKILTEKVKRSLQSSTMEILHINPPNLSCIMLQSGSCTFLSADIHIQPSGMGDLFKRAKSLVKMGLGFDHACTVQLGAAALLYAPSGENVETILLEQGVHNVPIITSVRRFYTKTITIKGFYLKDTEIKAIMSPKKSVYLNVIYYQELDDEGLEVLFAQIPHDEILGEKTLIYANKSVSIKGYANPLVLRSIAKKIDFQKHPSTKLGAMCTRQISITLSLLFVYQAMVLKVWRMPKIDWVFQLITSICSLLLVEYIIGPWESESKNSGENVDDTDSTREDQGTVNDEKWEWPCYKRVYKDGTGWIKELANAKERFDDVGKGPFEVVTTLLYKAGAKITLIVHSRLLIEVLKECEPKTGVVFRKGSEIDSKEIFYRREALVAYVDNNVQLSPGRVWHVKHVLRFMEQHYAEELEKYERMKAEGCVSYDMLWTFFKPGDGVCRRCLVTDQECFATVNDPAFYDVLPDGTKWCGLRLNVMDFNVRSYSKHTIVSKVADAFQGEVPFTSLPVWPLHVFPNRIQDLENRCIKMGDIFYHVAIRQPFCFKQFKGSINFYLHENGCMRLRKFNADGRVMIDLLSFARMNPDYLLGSAQPPCEVMEGVWTPESGQMKKPSNEELRMAPAFAYGFSFKLKKWGCFDVCGLREVNFNKGAFDLLTMKSDSQRVILWSMVEHYTRSESDTTNTTESEMQNHNQSPDPIAKEGTESRVLDPIANKGTGCIVLCHGPPGTGKTLTAEALAETMQRPLWSISAFELGYKADKVEKKLGQILEIAHLWRAILLLDEADAYLERRGEGVDVKRNLLTGVFLRVLEYYRGIMFLTTNRVTAFDDAILSRTTLTISYPPLDNMQRHTIWKTLLPKDTWASMDGDNDNAAFEALVQHKLNGRQIRNIVHLAQILAHAHADRDLQISDVFSALNAAITGTKDLPHQL